MSRLSANMGDEMIPGAVHRYPGIHLTAEDILGKPQLGDNLKKAVRPVISSNGIPYLQMAYEIAQHIRKGEGRKEGKDGVLKDLVLLSMEQCYHLVFGLPTLLMCCVF